MKNLELKNLIERGYFPQELPPPFNTSKLAEKINEVISYWDQIYLDNTKVNSPDFILTRNDGESKTQFKNRGKGHGNNFISQYNSSKNACFSISKGNLSRRFLGIPNPKHFIALSEKIVNNWELIQEIFNKSEYSISFPVVETSTNKRSVSIYSKKFNDSKNTLLERSFSKLIEVRADISKFYPTIYTHSITWAFCGKAKAKHYFYHKSSLEQFISDGDKEASLYKIADEIDMCLQSCQDKQSVGIPIGPDTSHIIAEIIACRIDNLLHEKFPNIKGCRYYDDYYLFVSTKDEADQALKGLQKILTDFQLEINESKVTIKEFPFSFEDDYAFILSQFNFNSESERRMEYDIRYYFSIIWELAEKSPSKSHTILKYALRKFEWKYIEVSQKNWKLFENLLLKTALIQPAILDVVTRIMLSYENYLDQDSKNKLQEIIEKTIINHSQMGHDFEVSWSLWLARTFLIKIKTNIICHVVEMKNSISLLILLDLAKNTQLLESQPDLSEIMQEVNSNIHPLFSEYWLFVYEAIKKEWLTFENNNLLEENQFFQILKNLNIEFYDTSKQLQVYSSKIKLTKNKIEESPQNLNTNEYTATSPLTEQKEITQKTDISQKDIIFSIPSIFY